MGAPEDKRYIEIDSNKPFPHVAAVGAQGEAKQDKALAALAVNRWDWQAWAKLFSRRGAAVS